MILQLTDIRKNLPFKISNPVSMDYIKDYAKNVYGDEIDWDVYLPSINKNLQRPFCWTLKQKQELIISVLKGIKLQPLSIIQYKDDSDRSKRKVILKIIDGKQRFSTLLSFYKNEFPIIWNEIEYYFKNLDDWAKREIAHLNLTANIVYEYPDTLIPDKDKIAWFEMINWAGTPQDEEHLKNLKK